MSWTKLSNSDNSTTFTYNTDQAVIDFPGYPTGIPTANQIVHFYLPNTSVKLNDIVFESTYQSVTYFWYFDDVWLVNDTDQVMPKLGYTVVSDSSRSCTVYVKKITCINGQIKDDLIQGYRSESSGPLKNTELFYVITKNIQTNATLDCTRLQIVEGAHLSLKNHDPSDQLTVRTSWLQIDGLFDTDEPNLYITQSNTSHVSKETSINITSIGTEKKGTISGVTIHCLRNSVISSLYLKNVEYYPEDRYTREIRYCTFLTPAHFSDPSLKITNIDFLEGFRSTNTLSDLVQDQYSNLITVSGPVSGLNTNSLII